MLEAHSRPDYLFLGGSTSHWEMQGLLQYTTCQSKCVTYLQTLRKLKVKCRLVDSSCLISTAKAPSTPKAPSQHLSGWEKKVRFHILLDCLRFSTEPASVPLRQSLRQQNGWRMLEAWRPPNGLASVKKKTTSSYGTNKPNKQLVEVCAASKLQYAARHSWLRAFEHQIVSLGLTTQETNRHPWPLPIVSPSPGRPFFHTPPASPLPVCADLDEPSTDQRAALLRCGTDSGRCKYSKVDACFCSSQDMILCCFMLLQSKSSVMMYYTNTYNVFLSAHSKTIGKLRPTRFMCMVLLLGPRHGAECRPMNSELNPLLEAWIAWDFNKRPARVRSRKYGQHDADAFTSFPTSLMFRNLWNEP